MYDYHEAEIRAERLEHGRDHCDSAGPVHDLAQLVSNDRILDPQHGAELTTTQARRLIYAVSADLRVHVGFDGERETPDAVKHETLFHNQPVAAAGEMQVADGIVAEINDRSGSYGTAGMLGVDRSMARALLAALERAGAPMTGPVLDFLRDSAGV